jgi:lysophospholipase L1-like esterase
MKSKLLSGLIFSALLILSMQSFGQYDSTKNRQPVSGYGFDWKNGSFKYLLKGPTDTAKLSRADSGSYAMKNSIVYFWTGFKWKAVSSGSGGGSVNSVTGLNTDNSDPFNPIVRISTDGSTITGNGTPGSPLVGKTIDSAALNKKYAMIPTIETVGNIFIDSFRRSSLGSNYLSTLPNTTVSMFGNKLTLTGGNNDSLNYIKYDWGTCSEKYTTVIRYVNKKISATSKGIAVGLFSNNIHGYAHHNRIGVYQNTGNANLGKVFFTNPSIGFTSIGSGTISSISVGDTIELRLDRNYYTITFTAKNITTGQSSSGTVEANPLVVNFAPTNQGNPAIWNYNGSGDSLTILSYNYTLNDLKNPEVMELSNSIGYGQKASSLDKRWASLFYNNTFQVVGSNGGGDVSQSIVDRLPEIKLTNPRYVVLMDGSNDVLFGIPISTTMANLQKIRDSVVSWKMTIIHACPSPRTSPNEKPLRDSIYNRFHSQNDIVVTATFDSLANGTGLIAAYNSGDGIHPTDSGHAMIAKMIKKLMPVTGFTQLAYIDPLSFHSGTGSNGQITYWSGVNSQSGSNNLMFSGGDMTVNAGKVASSTVNSISSLSSINLASNFPRALFRSGNTTGDTNVGFLFSPEQTSSGNSIPAFITLSNNKTITDAVTQDVNIYSNATKAVFSTTRGASTFSTGFNPIYFSPGKFDASTNTALILNNDDSSTVTLGSNSPITGAQVNIKARGTTALYSQGKIKIVDGTEGNGKVFTSDAAGVGSWVTPSGGISSVATLIPFGKTGSTNSFSTDNSLIYDSSLHKLNVQDFNSSSSVSAYNNAAILNTDTNGAGQLDLKDGLSGFRTRFRITNTDDREILFSDQIGSFSINGNSNTATTLATGRTISGTGEATFTTGSFNGSANVSGAVTLTNSAVIGKVLTGYASGSGTVAATDNILQAIQKLNGNDALKSTIASPSFTGIVTTPQLSISGNVTSAAWTTNGLRLKGVPGTLTDNSSSGTVATAYTDVLGGNTIAASNATTFTNYITMYLKDPTAGANVTMSNKYALGAESARFGTSNQVTVSNTGILSATSAALTTPIITTNATIPLIIGGTGTTSALTLQSTSGVGTTNADIIFKVGNNGATEGMRIANSGAISLGGALTSSFNGTFNNMTLTAGFTIPKTITAGGTTGAQTINKISGSVNFAAGASTLVVTNSSVSTTSLVLVQVYGTDATATSARVTLAAGSFTITLNAAATAETKVGFYVTN